MNYKICFDTSASAAAVDNTLSTVSSSKVKGKRSWYNNGSTYYITTTDVNIQLAIEMMYGSKIR